MYDARSGSLFGSSTYDCNEPTVESSAALSKRGCDMYRLTSWNSSSMSADVEVPVKSSLVWLIDGYSCSLAADRTVSSWTGSSVPMPLAVTTAAALSASGTSASATSESPPGLVALK